MPEPLDFFELPDGEPALVYALVGQGSASYLLRDKVQRWGYIDGRQQRQINDIARYLSDGIIGAIDVWLNGPAPRDVERLFALLSRVTPPWWPGSAASAAAEAARG